MSRHDPKINRRSLLGAAGALSAGSAASHAGAREQPPRFQSDATPEPTAQPALHDPSQPTELGPTIPPELDHDPTDWPTAQGNLKATRATKASPITSATIDQLEVAWRFTIEETGQWGAMTANPLVFGDRVFLQDSQSNVYALDKHTGEQLWKTEYGENNGGPNGMGIGYERMIVSLGDSGAIAALNYDTGEKRWRSVLTNSASETVELAPVIHDQIAYVSTNPTKSGASYRGGGRGIIHAVDVGSGKTLWTFDTTTDNLWGMPRINSGGGLWYPVSLDDEGNLYFGVGNAGPWPGTPTYPNGSSRPGPNDYANCLVSLETVTGAVRWHINARPHDLFDLDFQNTPVIATVEIDGVERKLAIGSGKTGTVIGADADTGEELWRAVVGEHENDELQEIPDTYTDDQPLRVLPGSFGGIIAPIAFQDGVVFVPIVNMLTTYTATGTAPGGAWLPQATGEVVALDAATGESLWQAEFDSGEFCGVVVVNDVVFGGGLDGLVRAFSTEDGSLLWTYQAERGLNTPFAVSGEYLIVPAAGAIIPSDDSEEPTGERVAEVIAFRIGGAATPES